MPVVCAHTCSVPVIVPLAGTRPALGRHVIIRLGVHEHVTSRACSCISAVLTCAVYPAIVIT